MPAYAGPGDGVPRVLVVDDEVPVIQLVREFLSRDSRRFNIETASDGYEALIKIGSFRPSVLILDVVMPRLDGVEVCRRLKADPATQNVRVLGLTGHPENVRMLIEAGAEACLTKPVRLPELKREVDRLLTGATM